MTANTHSLTVPDIRALETDEIDAVTGAGINLGTLGGGLGCFPIFTPDGKGGVIITSPTLGRLPWAGGRVLP
ncbi:MAG: hypothetical protein AB1749_06735 [Pseudomonadota bacterium]